MVAVGFNPRFAAPPIIRRAAADKRLGMRQSNTLAQETFAGDAEVRAWLGFGAYAFVYAVFVTDGFHGFRRMTEGSAKFRPGTDLPAFLFDIECEQVSPRHHHGRVEWIFHAAFPFSL